MLNKFGDCTASGSKSNLRIYKLSDNLLLGAQANLPMRMFEFSREQRNLLSGTVDLTSPDSPEALNSQKTFSKLHHGDGHHSDLGQKHPLQVAILEHLSIMERRMYC